MFAQVSKRKVEFWWCKISWGAYSYTINKSTTRTLNNWGDIFVNAVTILITTILRLFNDVGFGLLVSKNKMVKSMHAFFSNLFANLSTNIGWIIWKSSTPTFLLYLQYYNIKCILSSSKSAIVVPLRIVKSAANLCQNNYHLKPWIKVLRRTDIFLSSLILRKIVNYK